MARGQRILITGASGFIGACLARDLIAAGENVHLILRATSSRWRLAGLEGQYVAHRADLRDADAVQRAVKSCKPEVIYHLAAHGAYASQKDRATILATNLIGTANLLDALRGWDYQALVNAGSSSEYGHKVDAMREDDCLEPRTDYAVAKAAATLLCQAEAYKTKPVATVRIFSAYGPWEEPSRLVPYVMDCCYRGMSPKVTAGWQPRDFIYVDDVVDLMKLAARDSRAHGQIVNAGTGKQHTVRDMIQTIVAVCGGGRIKPLFGSEPLRADEPTHWVASVERATVLLDWRPRFDLRGGIERMWQWYMESAASRAA
jgi:nucleoside-diphosphate-sugar epimerase